MTSIQIEKAYVIFFRLLFSAPFLLAGTMAISSTLAAAEIIESVEYKYYKISPRSVHEIKPELTRRSPIRSGGSSFNGHTDWYINWQFQTGQVQTGPGQFACQLYNIKTKVHVVHILPRLSRYVSDPQTIDTFKKFNTILTQHELNHGRNGLSAAREINKKLQLIKPQTNCFRLSRYADDLGNDIVRYFTNKDKEYDRVTQNGETEGAVIY